MTDTVPMHVGYIMDGNRRWAREHGLPGYEGHMAGYNAFKEVIEATFQAGVKFVSVYAFSTENWSRTEAEVNKLMSLTLRAVTKDLNMMLDNGIRLRFLGARDRLSDKLQRAVADAEEKTANGNRGVLAVCFNYGGQQEIVDACKKIIQSGVSADEVTPELIGQNLYAPEVPPVDVVVRTSGEQRLSNFMLWRAAYSEFVFVKKYWPDMTKDDVTSILEEYTSRQRRFGG